VAVGAAAAKSSVAASMTDSGSAGRGTPGRRRRRGVAASVGMWIVLGAGACECVEFKGSKA